MHTVLMTGNPATGKTHTARLLGRELAADLRVRVLTSLEFRVRYDLFDLRDEAQRNRVYALLAEEVRREAEGRGTAPDILVLDANFNRRERREMIYASVPPGRMTVVRCVTGDPRVIEARLAERREHSEIYENKAASRDLYEFIRDSGDPVEEDDRVAGGLTPLILRDTAGRGRAEFLPVSGGTRPFLAGRILKILRQADPSDVSARTASA